MTLDATQKPTTDPTPIFEHYRAGFASNLLIAAVSHFRLFDLLAAGPMTEEDLRSALGLANRPYVVLMTAIRAMGLVEATTEAKLQLSATAREQLTADSYFSIADYLRLAAESPAVVELVERLRTNRPANCVDQNAGAAFIFREGMDSAMEKEASARQLTLALAGRAKNVAPVLAERVPMPTGTLLDVAGGTGIYAIAFLQKNPGLRAIVLDRPEVLKIAREFGEAYGVSERLDLVAGDMFTAPFPSVDHILLSNVLHDWDVPECKALVQKSAACLRPGGQLVIHDVLLNDALDGPLAIACYSAQLFTITEGRAYSAAEYRAWIEGAGMRVVDVVPTLAHCYAICAEK